MMYVAMKLVRNDTIILQVINSNKLQFLVKIKQNKKKIQLERDLDDLNK